ncbi:MAG: 50S ribosomal protein L7 [Oscillospiraceae bacterium]|nr:50S ribosomal protein L7 [Oscillospiraceae bacterium]
MNSNALNTLGLCKKAGKLVTGFDAVVADIRNAAGVLVTSDLSEKTRKEITFHCDKHNRKLVELDCTMTDIQNVLNKKTGIIAVLDKGFFESITK